METQPRLSRGLVASLTHLGATGVDLPSLAALDLPEKVVQFGTGAFLRGFAEFFIDAANRRGMFNGSIVAVSSTGSSRDGILNEQDGLFTLAIQGVDRGVARQDYRVVASLSRALSARDEWDAVLSVARDPAIELVISNTTEVGIAIDEADRFDADPPISFPAKLTRFLAERANAFGRDGRRGLIVLPCELIEQNGATLRRMVLELANRWKLDGDIVRWISDSVVFCNTLVDRIVPGALPADDEKRVARSLGYRDSLLTSCEPYALFVIEGDELLRRRLAFADADNRVVVTSDIAPYRERKVRVLNGGHTILVPVALLAGFETVYEACEDERVGGFLRRAVLEEIVPSLSVPNGEDFARDVFARFTNPYIRHALIDITLHGATKMRLRVVPSIVEYAERTGRAPTALAFGFAAYLAFMRGETHVERRSRGLSVPEDREGERVAAAWRDVDPESVAEIAELARNVCADADLWGMNLTSVAGFADVVAHHLVRIVRHGIAAALDTHLAEPAVI